MLSRRYQILTLVPKNGRKKLYRKRGEKKQKKELSFSAHTYQWLSNLSFQYLDALQTRVDKLLKIILNTSYCAREAEMAIVVQVYLFCMENLIIFANPYS